MSTSDTFTKQQWQDQEALHRFQLISPLLQTDLDDAKRLQLRRAILMRITFLSVLFTDMKKHSQKNSSQVLNQLIVKNTVHRIFRKILRFFWDNCNGLNCLYSFLHCFDFLNQNKLQYHISVNTNCQYQVILYYMIVLPYLLSFQI